MSDLPTPDELEAAFAEHAEETGKTWLKTRDVADRWGTKPEQLSDAVRRLHAQGRIERWGERGNRGGSAWRLVETEVTNDGG